MNDITLICFRFCFWFAFVFPPIFRYEFRIKEMNPGKAAEGGKKKHLAEKNGNSENESRHHQF